MVAPDSERKTDFIRKRKMKKLLIFCFMFCMLAIPSLPVYAQSAKEAVMALKKMEARVQSGIAYRDYSPALGETKFSVNVYLEDPEAKKNPELTSLIKRVMVHYEQAGFVFKESLSGPYRYLDHTSTVLSKESQLREISEQQIYKGLIEQYPEANKFIEDGGALDRDKSDKGKDINNLKYGRILDLNHLLPMIFKRASEDLRSASTLLSKANANVEENKNDIEKLKKENDELKAEILKLKKEIDDLKMEITKLKKK